jgi:hypothetical protein
LNSDRPAVYTPFLRRFTDEKARDLSETIQLYNQVRAGHYASRWSSPDIREKVFIEIAELMEDSVGLPDNTELNRALGRCVLEVIDQETTVFTFPEIEWPVANLSMKEQLDLRRFLRAKEHFLANEERVWETLKRSIATVTVGLIKALPPLALDAALSVPLFSMMRDARNTVDKIIGTINTEEHQTLGLFTKLQQTFYENVCEASGIPPDADSKKRLVTADKSDLPPAELVETYLQNTPFFNLFQTPVPFAVPDHIRFSGHWVIAPPGRGKTTLLLSMLMEDFKKDAAIIIMDSKGDLIAPIRDLKALEDRYVIIDPDPEHPVAINPLDIPKTDISLAVANLEYIFSSLLESKMTPLQTVLFRSVLRALIIAFPNPTLETFRDLISNGFGKYEEYIQKLPQDLQDFFYNEFNTKVYEDRKREIVWRLRLLLENDTVRSMMLAVRTRFDIGAAMDAGKVIIINNSKAILGDQGAEFFGRFFIAQVLAAAQARSNRRPEDKKPVYFYIDECQNVIARDERTPTILDECRSQKVALILAHQRTEQITSPNVLSALANCGVRYANSDDEARNLAPRLRTTVDFLQSLNRGEFAAYVRDMTKQAISIAVTPVDFDSVEKLSSAARGAMTERMRARYGVPPAQPLPVATARPSITEQAIAKMPPKPKKQSTPKRDAGEPSKEGW